MTSAPTRSVFRLVKEDATRVTRARRAPLVALVVDDEESVRTFVDRVLRDGGYETALKVLYLTGFSDRLFKDRGTLWEDEAFIDKPCSGKGLLQAVSTLMFGRLNAPKSHPSGKDRRRSFTG